MLTSPWEEISSQIDGLELLAVKVIILLATIITGYQFLKKKLRD